MIIILSGLPGSGKSTVGTLIAQKLGYGRYSTGDIQRELGKEQGMTIVQWGEAEAKDPKYDHMVDERTKKLITEKDNIVIDSWLAAHFVSQTPKAGQCPRIFLEGEETERARRRLAHKRPEEQFESMDETITQSRKRVADNRERWLRYYKFDILDMANYDLVIDTTNHSPEQIVRMILDFVKSYE